MAFMPKIDEAFGALREDAARLRAHLPDADDRVLPREDGLVTAGFLLRHTKYAFLIIFIVAAVISPGTDVVSQCLMAARCSALYASASWLPGSSASLKLPEHGT